MLVFTVPEGVRAQQGSGKYQAFPLGRLPGAQTKPPLTGFDSNGSAALRGSCPSPALPVHRPTALLPAGARGPRRAAGCEGLRARGHSHRASRRSCAGAAPSARGHGGLSPAAEETQRPKGPR